MIEKAYWLFEILAVLICLSSINGKKFKIDIYNAVFIAVEMLLMQTMQDEIVSRSVFFVVYLMYGIYAYLEFGDSIKRTIAKSLSCMMIVGIVQMALYIPVSFVGSLITNESLLMFVLNSCLLVLVVITRKSKLYMQLEKLYSGKEWIVKCCVGICIIIFGYNMFKIKYSSKIVKDVFFLAFIGTVMVGVLFYKWQKANNELEAKVREKEKQDMYNESFKELISIIRKRQHDFNNELDAIYGMQLTANSMDELIEKQKDFIGEIKNNSKYTKILSCVNNSTLAGFIYTKCIRADKHKIEVEYNLSYEGSSEIIPSYDLVEIIGILFDNAIEAIVANNDDKRKIHFELIDDFKKISVCIKNHVVNFTREDAFNLFTKPHTTKGEGRGLGLQKIKDYQKEYEFDILSSLENDILTIETVKYK